MMDATNCLQTVGAVGPAAESQQRVSGVTFNLVTWQDEVLLTDKTVKVKSFGI